MHWVGRSRWRLLHCIRTYGWKLEVGDVCYDELLFRPLIKCNIFFPHCRFWDPRTYSRVHSSSALHAGHIYGLDVATRGSTLLTCGQDNKLKIFDTRTYSLIENLSHRHFVVSLHCGKPAISSDGRLAVAGSASGVVYVWDVSSKRVIAQLESHKTPVVACSWSSTIPQLASCDTSGNVVIWG